jgi:hypothetical protein
MPRVPGASKTGRKRGPNVVYPKPCASGLWTARDVAGYLGMATTTVQYMLREGKIVSPVQPYQPAIPNLWDAEQVQQWAKNRGAK